MMHYLDYQVKGVEFAIAHKRCLIADEMGLGKTVQAIGVINALENVYNRIMIICPTSLIGNWRNELAAWLRPNNNRKIEIFGYEALSKLSVPKLDLLIIDEAHFVKDPKTLRHQQTKRISRQAEHIIMLTGTPIENRPLELFGLLSILDPDTWDPAGKKRVGKKYVLVDKGEGAGFWHFAKRYCDAKKITLGRGPKAKSFWEFGGASNLEELKEKLYSTLMIRRLKKDVLTELPEKQHCIVILPGEEEDYFPELNSDNYETVIRKIRADKVAFTEFSKKRHEQGIKKVDAVIEHIKLCLEEVDKVIIFAHHAEVISRLGEVLNYYGAAFMTSDMSVAERTAAAERFQNDSNCHIIIGSYDIMGVGFTLTAASLVVLAEIDPVPGRIAQAVDRAHRIGQKDRVLVHYCVVNGSIDARMCKILIKKQKVLEAALNVVRDTKIADDIDLENSEFIISKTCNHSNITVIGGHYRCKDCNVIMR